MPSGVRAPLLNQLSSIPISPFPPAEVRSKLSQDEWNASLEAWITITRVFLSLPAKEFSSAQLASLASFLHSYFTELAATTGHDVTIHDSKALDLRSSCYFLAHRTLSEPSPPSILLHWDFLAKLSRAFPRSESLRKLLRSLRESSQVEQTLKKTNDSLVKALDSGSLEAEETLIQLVPLIRTSPDMGAFLMTGADLLDSLCSAYPNASSSLRKKLVAIAYLGLVSLIKVETPNQSSLLDHLYSMRSNVETMQNQKSKKQEERRDHLLSDLVTNTPIVHVIEEMLSGPDAARAKNLKSALAAYGTPQPHFRNGHVSRKSNKGKAKANDEEYEQEIHAHQMSLVSQIQDLFPDLGSGFIVKLLHEYNDDVEQVTAHLLEDTLPPHLAQSDRTIELCVFTPAACLSSIITAAFSTIHNLYLSCRTDAYTQALASLSFSSLSASPILPNSSQHPRPRCPRQAPSPHHSPPPRPHQQPANRRHPALRPLQHPLQISHLRRPRRLRPGLRRARRHLRRRRRGRRARPDVAGPRRDRARSPPPSGRGWAGSGCRCRI